MTEITTCTCSNDMFLYCSNPIQIEAGKRYPLEHPDPQTGKPLTTICLFHIPCKLDKLNCGFTKTNTEVNKVTSKLGQEFESFIFANEEQKKEFESKKSKRKSKQKVEIVQPNMF